jgi:hypothetical protein
VIEKETQGYKILLRIQDTQDAEICAAPNQKKPASNEELIGGDRYCVAFLDEFAATSRPAIYSGPAIR